MKQAIAALKFVDELPDFEADYIGVDFGATVLSERGIRMVFSVGDFDSVREEDMAKITEFSDRVICLNPVKDDSDSEHAVVEALKEGYERIWLCGPFGGRCDHSIVNLRLVMKYPGLVGLYDTKNKIICYGEGTYMISKGEYTYVSFFTNDHAEISLDGFKYPLQNRKIDYQDLYTVSNEIQNEKGILVVHSGAVMVVQSKD